jgi:hypothetical protein
MYLNILRALYEKLLNERKVFYFASLVTIRSASLSLGSSTINVCKKKAVRYPSHRVIFAA